MIAVVVAVALGVEASWTVGGWPAAATTSASVLVLALVRPEVVLDVVWNVWFALLFLVCAFCSSLATASGHLRWWPVAVVSSSVVVQCQAAYAPPAIALCLVAPLLGLAVRRRRGERLGGGWWIVGLAVGVTAWAAPVAQEATARPGNLTLLARAAGGSGATIGWHAALRALGGATRPLPAWVRPLPTGGPVARFFGVVGLVSGPAWWGLVVLGLLATIAVLAWRTGRTVLAVLATLAAALALGSLATVATIPVSQFVVLGYLGALLVPAGLTVWVTLVWAAGAVVVVGLRRWRSDGDGDDDGGHGPATEAPVLPVESHDPLDGRPSPLAGLSTARARRGTGEHGRPGTDAGGMAGRPGHRSRPRPRPSELRRRGLFGLRLEGLPLKRCVRRGARRRLPAGHRRTRSPPDHQPSGTRHSADRHGTAPPSW